MKNKRVGITIRPRKFIAAGCSHGGLALRSALDGLLKFKEEYKPHVTAHLGDATDTSCWRAGARDTKDEGESVEDDMASGLGFLQLLRPDVFCLGNHEFRIWKHADHPNAIIREAARATIAHMREVITQEIGARFIETYDIERSWVRIGPALMGHGWMFNENAIRDHAEYVGTDCIIAHLHRQGLERARQVRGATGWCVGYLGDREKFGYAHARKATSKWTVGFAYGEFTDKWINVNLHRITTPQTGFPSV
jgi:hypothetical protein